MLLSLLLFLPFTETAVIKTALGAVKGKEFIANDGSLIHSFRHIPFAKAPIGTLRFALPVSAEPWKGILDGTEYGPACMSNSTVSSSPQKWIDEDCLHNNIFVSDRCLKSKKGCPVVFYIHGGGFNYDSAPQKVWHFQVMFPDEDLVNNFGAEDVVLVITAFRLGALATIAFSTDNVVPRNLPVYDIIESLKWVQENIEVFGGNRKSVTLLGHSGGGAAVGSLSFSKSIDPKRKLFHRGISMSGPGIMTIDETTRRLKTWEFAQKAGCLPIPFMGIPSDNYSREVVECLRTRDAHLLVGIQRQMEEDGYNFEGFILQPPLFPATSVYDFMHNPPKIPMMLGTTLREMDGFERVAFQAETLADIMGLQRPMAITSRYYEDQAAGRLPFNNSAQSQLLFVGSVSMSEEITKTGSDAYLYSYRNPRHSEHTDDLAYLMGVHKFDMDENEVILAELYPKYFINFIKYGVPHPDWETFRIGDDNYFSIDINVKTGLRPKNELHFEKAVVAYWTRNMTRLDRSLGPYFGFEKRTVSLPVILTNDSVGPAVRSYFTPTQTAVTNWTTLIFSFGLVLTGFLVGRCSAPTRKREFYVAYPDEVTPLVFK